MTSTHSEWAVRYTHLDSTITYGLAGDRAHAELIADGKATYLASLNEATREYVGIDAVDVVSRTVSIDGDGTMTIRPWHFERPGVPEGETDWRKAQ
jgi:hypothetical protein